MRDLIFSADLSTIKDDWSLIPVVFFYDIDLNRALISLTDLCQTIMSNFLDWTAVEEHTRLPKIGVVRSIGFALQYP